tara:strand:- start:293 stop:454 length:162 start_codon:yes stop_codon:yes gene_type:complete
MKDKEIKEICDELTKAIKQDDRGRLDHLILILENYSEYKRTSEIILKKGEYSN